MINERGGKERGYVERKKKKGRNTNNNNHSYLMRNLLNHRYGCSLKTSIFEISQI